MSFIFLLIFTPRITGKYLGIFFIYLIDSPSKHGILWIEARTLQMSTVQIPTANNFPANFPANVRSTEVDTPHSTVRVLQLQLKMSKDF